MKAVLISFLSLGGISQFLPQDHKTFGIEENEYTCCGSLRVEVIKLYLVDLFNVTDDGDKMMI